MNKVQSGLLCIGLAVLMQVVGRLLITAMRPSPNVVLAGLMALWMFVSVVLLLFGLFRLITALLHRERPAPPP
ncbi:MAG: hypothetical protein JO316_08855 [Abitibacteriaceae bacterium]|nr:hypothetical protein [Abditibacteriaceae bacterium]